MDKEEPKLKSTTVGLMIGTALMIDLLQFLLGFIYLGWAVGIFASLTFWLWFRMHGIKIGLSNPKRSLGFAGAGIIEMIPIPFLASLPAWTVFVSTTALMNKMPLGGGEGITKLGIMK